MSVFRKIVYVVAILLVILFVAALVMPKRMHVETAITIEKPVEEVYEFARFVGNMDEVSVWMTMDPLMKVTNTGTDGTVGFVSHWDSNNKNVGVGEQEIKVLIPNQRIESELRFIKPNESTAQAYITTVPDGDDKTHVTWAFDGQMPFPLNVMNPMIKNQLRGQLNIGLENMKAKLESN